MSKEPVDLAVLARNLADSLEASGITYALGGALALGQWTLPRGTSDIDLTVFLEENEWHRALAVLEKEGAILDFAKTMDQLRERGSSRVPLHGFHADIFVPSIIFYESVKLRIVQRPLLGRPASFITAEDLSVFRMLFFRPKDTVDVRYMLATQGKAFDRDYVRRWLAELLGESDERIIHWDEICSDIPWNGM